ncbi:MAG: hypothetical protein RSA58_10990, partial [Glutamicibacter sp.]
MVFARNAVAAMAGEASDTGCDISGLVVQEISAPTPQTPLDLEQLQTAASSKLGVYRTGVQLEEMVQLLATSAPVAATAREQSELRNLWTTARIIAAGSMARTKSLGAHHRLDSTEFTSSQPDEGVRYGWTLHPSELDNENLLSKELNA